MSLSEVLVSALILGVSSQVALQGWLRVLDLQRDGQISQQALQRSDQLLLAARRLLSSTAAAASTDLTAERSCQLSMEDASQLLAPDHLASQQRSASVLTTRWQAVPALDGLSLQLAVQAGSGGHPPLQRRVLFTAAGLGRCPGAEG